jgi:16S rRNA (cytosine967-C5)-methyltransferase
MSAREALGAREVALSVVRDVFGPEHRAAQAALDVRARRARLDLRDRAFAAELAYGSIKQRRLIDWYLKPYLAGRAKALPPAIAEILRLGVYQLRFMGGVEDRAAVFETVALASRHGHRGTAGLVNAILRRMIADTPPAPQPDDFENENDFIAVAFSVPTWIATAWRRTFDGALEALLAGINAAPQQAVRVNALRAEVEQVAAEIGASGATVRRSAFVAETLLVDGRALADDPGLRWSLQGEAACMAVDILAPQPGERVLELCAGRGNKSVQIAARMQGRGELECVERDAAKARALETTLREAGADNAAVVLGDATVASGAAAGAVLLDAPCSGLGILGRHPEARWRKSPDAAARLAVAQAAMLRAAASRVEPGGRIVYSVCSNDPREGIEVIESFLSEWPAFERVPLPARYEPFARDGDLVVPPGIDGRDGFFIASLRRVE